MGLFDGLIAKVENEVTSVESRAAGLVTSAASAVGVPPSFLSFLTPTPPGATPSAGMTTTPFVGPLLPGQARPAPRPMAVYTPPAADPAPFNMVADMLSHFTPSVSGVESTLAKIPGVGSLESFLGLSPTLTTGPDHPDDSQAWAKDLTNWSNILKSLDASMNQKNGASDLSAAYRSWVSGPYNDALSQIAAWQNGHSPYATAQAVYQNAVAQAKTLQAAIQDRWSQTRAAGPTVADYAHAAVDTGTEAASRAVTATEKFGTNAAAALDTTSSLLKYAPWILGGFAALYVYSLGGGSASAVKRYVSRARGRR
jgi:hypothetical protein